jgi:two-component system alkaline phosphatase synthesis response regulator PhoP
MAKTILLVDDSATARMRSRMIFASMKQYEFLSAGDGKEGVEMALEKKPDLILMDVEMPRMNGIEACRALRENAATRRIPIVLLTMRSEDSAVQKGFDGGCTEYLAKPVSEEKLVAVLKKYLG